MCLQLASVSACGIAVLVLVDDKETVMPNSWTCTANSYSLCSSLARLTGLFFHVCTEGA